MGEKSPPQDVEALRMLGACFIQRSGSGTEKFSMEECRHKDRAESAPVAGPGIGEST